MGFFGWFKSLFGTKPAAGPWIYATASSFADPADVEAFRRCKAQGHSDQHCFSVGDNGIGQFGANTATESRAYVALHEEDMISQWGSVKNAAHQLVQVEGPSGRVILAAVEDRLGVRKRIDLNPGSAWLLGLKPPFLVECRWRKV